MGYVYWNLEVGTARTRSSSKDIEDLEILDNIIKCIRSGLLKILNSIKSH